MAFSNSKVHLSSRSLVVPNPNKAQHTEREEEQRVTVFTNRRLRHPQLLKLLLKILTLVVVIMVCRLATNPPKNFLPGEAPAQAQAGESHVGL